MEPEGSLPHSQVPATYPYPEPAQCNPPTSHSLKIQCLGRTKVLVQVQGFASEYFLTNIKFPRWGVVSSSPNPEAGGPHLVGWPRLFIQYTPIYHPYWKPFLHPQPKDAPCRNRPREFVCPTLFVHTKDQPSWPGGIFYYIYSTILTSELHVIAERSFS
jgi:hypothetical protein